MTGEHEAATEIRSEVLGYFDDHPQAADSLEAIQHWWLLHRLYRYSNEQIRKALAQLVRDGLVERRVLTGGGVIYSRARELRELKPTGSSGCPDRCHDPTEPGGAT